MCMNVDKPQKLYKMGNLQFQPSLGALKMLTLQNGELVLASACRDIGLHKKNVLTDP